MLCFISILVVNDLWNKCHFQIYISCSLIGISLMEAVIHHKSVNPCVRHLHRLATLSAHVLLGSSWKPAHLLVAVT